MAFTSVEGVPHPDWIHTRSPDRTALSACAPSMHLRRYSSRQLICLCLPLPGPGTFFHLFSRSGFLLQTTTAAALSASQILPSRGSRQLCNIPTPGVVLRPANDGVQ